MDHYKMMKYDPIHKEHLFNDHDNLADTRRSECVYLAVSLAYKIVGRHRRACDQNEAWTNILLRRISIK